MPGDDPLDTGETTKTTEPVQTTAPDTVTREEFQSALATMDKNVGAAFGQVMNRLETQTTKEPTADPKTTASDDSVLNQLVEDPKGVIGAEVKEQLRALAPHMLTQIKDKHGDILQQHAYAFDDMYGPGAFQEHIAPDLADIQLSPEMKSSAEAMNELVNVIKGRKMTDLFTARNDWETKKEEMKKEQEAQIPVMLSGGMAAPQKGKLGAQEEQFVNDFTNKHGGKLNVKDLTAFRDAMPQNRTMTEDDFDAITPKETK
tara:strand:- start:3386 stop:4162 length:777 start_codon:yes stop_codon:yes gene_type:complete